MARLLIFNLPRAADTAAVRALIDAWRSTQGNSLRTAAGFRGSPAAAGTRARVDPVIALHTITGAQGELFAVVHLPDTRRQARELARHLNGRSHVGDLAAPRPLWSWLPAMAWT